METMNIYCTGVGGQGIGLLSEVLIRAADYAGYKTKGVDTHGLAQRGGIVISQIRIGDTVNSPLIPSGGADIVIALERHEALRGMIKALKSGGTLIYYNTVWQPLPVRLKMASEIKESDVSSMCEKMNVKEIKVFSEGLEDTIMQNIVMLAKISSMKLIRGIGPQHYRSAMEDLMDESRLQKNLELFEKESV